MALDGLAHEQDTDTTEGEFCFQQRMFQRTADDEGAAYQHEDEDGSAVGPLPGFEDGDDASNYEGRALGNVDESNTKICGEVFEITECASW